MSNELKTGETVALVASDLRSHACALADEYGRFLHQKEKKGKQPEAKSATAGEQQPEARNAKGEPEIESKQFQARHVAGRAALAHLDLLLRIARTIDGDDAAGGAAQESEADWEAEAARNLARPA